MDCTAQLFSGLLEAELCTKGVAAQKATGYLLLQEFGPLFQGENWWGTRWVSKEGTTMETPPHPAILVPKAKGNAKAKVAIPPSSHPKTTTTKKDQGQAAPKPTHRAQLLRHPEGRRPEAEVDVR